MKASRILAGLSAVSLAASMLSMVAASADNPFTVDEGEATGFTGFANDPEPDEEGVEIVSDTTTGTETATASDYDFAAMWNKRPWYNAMGPVASFPGFPGWPGWGFKAFPAGWEWIEFYKNLQNHVWEEFAEKDQDTAAAGYLVFEFEGGKKQVVPVDVDSNGQYVTDEFLIPFMNVQKVYFLYEVSEAPYFSLKLDAFNVNGKDVELNKDNAANGVNNYRRFADGADAIEGVWEEIPEFYQNTIFDKGNDNLVINHGLILWGTKVKVTFTVDGIGKYPVHPEDKEPGQLNNGLGDDKGDVHTHINPDQAGGVYGSGQKKNLAEGITPVNPMYWSTDTRSADLYDALVDVYNSKDDHSADAEISFKTISDQNGVLVANFLNIWDVDKDQDGNEAHWLKDFTPDGYAIYVRKQKVTVQSKKYEEREFNVAIPSGKDADGNDVYETNDKGEYPYKVLKFKCDGGEYMYTDGKIKPVAQKRPEIFEYENKEEEHWVFDGGENDGHALGENKEDLGEGPYADGTKFLADDKTEVAYCWHPYFVTENGLVDVVTKNDLGRNKTNPIAYNSLTDAEIEYMRKNNGMYYNDDLHSAAVGHFVVFGDNTLREYKYRIKAEAVKAMLEAVQRSVALRDEFIWEHGAKDIWQWVPGTDTAQFGPNNKLIISGDHAYAFDKDHESMSYLDSQTAVNYGDYVNGVGSGDKGGNWEHHRGVHGAIWLQCCEGTILRDVRVHAHTDIITQDTIPTLYGKENYDALFPKKPAESKAEAANGGAAQPTADAGAADNNTESGAAAGFGIAGLLLAGAAMVCVKKKN